MRARREIDMTQGAIARQLILYALPLLIGDFLQQLYNTADSVIVGQFVSKQALAAVGATSNIINVLIGLFTGVSTGATVIISRYYGAKEKTRLKSVVRIILQFTLLLGIVFTVAGICATERMLCLMGTPEDVFSVARTYLFTYFSGITGLVLYNMCAGILRAVGDSKRPLYVLAFASVLNVLLDLLFIVGCSMGVAGAALATSLSQFLSSLILLRIIIHSELVEKNFMKNLHIDAETVRSVCLVGFPVGIQKSVIALSNTIVISYVNHFGSGAMAAWSVYQRLDQIILFSIMSMSAATTTFVAQNLGAKQPERIQKGIYTAMIMAIIAAVFYAGVFVCFREPLIRFFHNDHDILFYGKIMLSVLIPLHPLTAVTQVLAGALRGQGDSTGPMLIIIFSYVVVRQLYLHLGSAYTEIFLFVVMGYPFSWLVAALSMVVYTLLKLRLQRYADGAKKE